MAVGIAEHSELTALLGPTNTGKTHRAVERMLQHHSGMIGLPLRLLAREIYDRISSRVGERAVALVTGEEKRVPARPRYWICTVESMPVDRTVDFVAVDEIQLCTHPQRGHVFTDRLLNARGRLETWFMGAATMRPLMAQLVPTATVQRHPRLSKLHATGQLGLSALPPRTALIAFSANEVYELADKLRRRRGGAAVVLGALSPRTRNAQVAMYQAGEVDFIVATDAIGMGLNMDVDHVAFAALHKFDGLRRRMLTPAELAQIAGRAGRHTRDGSFGSMSPALIPDDMAFAVESHRFMPYSRVMWRNSELEFGSIQALQRSLAKRPPRRELTMVERADDSAVLEVLAGRARVVERAFSERNVRLLWEVCSIPDFRRLLPEHHANLLEELFLQLCRHSGRLDPAFMHERISRLESDHGDIDELMMRMETIRTWSYIAHRPDWVAEAEVWQQRTQRAEDALSQSLHQRLIDRFVERARKRGSTRRATPRQRKSRRGALVEQAPSGPFAQLSGLRDKLSPARDSQPEQHLGWVDAVVEAQHSQFVIDERAQIQFDDGSVIAQLTSGQDLLRPGVRLYLDREPGGGARARLLRRMRAYVRDLIGEVLGPLADDAYEQLTDAARGLAYQLRQRLGAALVAKARVQLKQLPKGARQRLRAEGIVFGHRYLYYRQGLTPLLMRARVALLSAHQGKIPLLREDVRHAPALLHANGLDNLQCLAIGYARMSDVALRLDVLEGVAGALHNNSGQLDEARLSPLNLAEEELAVAIKALGYRRAETGYVRSGKRRRRRRPRSG